MGEPLRTGSICPHCKKGKLYPSGLRREIGVPEKRSGEIKRNQTEFKCDKCRRKFNAYGIELRN